MNNSGGEMPRLDLFSQPKKIDYPDSDIDDNDRLEILRMVKEILESGGNISGIDPRLINEVMLDAINVNHHGAEVSGYDGDSSNSSSRKSYLGDSSDDENGAPRPRLQRSQNQNTPITKDKLGGGQQTKKESKGR